MNDLAQTLEDRKAIHGEFSDHARIAQELKNVAHGAPSWPYLSPVEREALEMVLHKVGRICAGNPHHPDHWHDIAGYARLVEERLP